MAKPLTKVEFTNLNKILYPEPKITKAKIIEYYIKKAPMMLDILADRPIVLTRFPDGVDKPGFYEKDAPMGTPSWVETFKRYSETTKRDINYIIVNELDTLVWLANLAALEMHMTLSRKDSFENPDFVLFDIDPEPPANFDDAVDAAMLLKEELEHLGLTSYVKTSGKRIACHYSNLVKIHFPANERVCAPNRKTPSKRIRNNRFRIFKIKRPWNRLYRLSAEFSWKNHGVPVQPESHTSGYCFNTA